MCVTRASFRMDCQKEALPPPLNLSGSLPGKAAELGEGGEKGVQSFALASGREEDFPLTQRHNLNNLNDCGQESYPLIPSCLGGGVSIKVWPED